MSCSLLIDFIEKTPYSSSMTSQIRVSLNESLAITRGKSEVDTTY